MPNIKLVPFDKLLKFLPKSKIKAGDGQEKGKYPFFKSGNDQTKFIDIAIFEGESLIIGDGGSANINFFDKKFSASDHCYVIQKESENVDVKFVYYYLKSNLFILEAGFKGAGIKNISKKYLSQIQIPLLPLEDQQKIAQLLSQIEALISKRKESINLLDELIKSTFLDMFGDPVINERKWKTVPFHKVGKFTSGGTPDKSRDDFWNGDFPWISPKDMKVLKIKDSIDHISESVFDETSLKRVSPDHLLIVVRGMILAHSFPVAINTVEIAINQDMKAINPAQGINVVYLQNCLIALKRQILKLMTTAGHGTRKFDSMAMRKLLIPKPPEDLQNQFIAIVQEVEQLKTMYQKSLEELNNLFASIAQKAFKGEVDVSKIELIQNTNDDFESQQLILDQPDSANAIVKQNETQNFSVWKDVAKPVLGGLALGMVAGLAYDILTTKNEVKKDSNVNDDVIKPQKFDEVYEAVTRPISNTLPDGSTASGVQIDEAGFFRLIKAAANHGATFEEIQNQLLGKGFSIAYNEEMTKSNKELTYKESVFELLKNGELIQEFDNEQKCIILKSAQ